MKQVSAALMTPVRPLSIDAVELPHPFGKVALRGLNKHVVVIGHQAVGMTAPVEVFHHAFENLQERQPVIVILIDRLTPAAS